MRDVDSSGKALGSTGTVQAALVARRYYLDGVSKSEIAAEFGVSRFKVARILEEALSSGLVRIEIAAPVEHNVALADELRRRFALGHAVVVDVDDVSEVVVREYLARAAAGLLDEIVTKDDVLGIGYGRTLTMLAKEVRRLPPCQIVQLTGALFGVNPSDNSVELVRQIAARSGGVCHSIYAPQVLPDERTATLLRAQREVSEAYAQFDEVTKAVVAVGSWKPARSQLRDALTTTERKALLDQGVIAEVCAVLLDARGQPVAKDFSRRCLSISGQQLKRVPEVIAVAGGYEKSAALLAVLAGGYATSVVVDRSMAAALLASA